MLIGLRKLSLLQCKSPIFVYTIDLTNKCSYGNFPTGAAPFAGPSLPNTASFKSQVSENADPTGRFNARLKIESPESKVESPTVAVLSKRALNVNTQSPVKSEGDVSTGRHYGISGYSDAKSSPIRPTRYSSTKSSPSKGTNLVE